MVVAKQLVHEVKSFRRSEVLVVRVHKLGPGLARVVAYQGFQLLRVIVGSER